MAFFNIKSTDISNEIIKTIQQTTPMNVTMVGGKLRTIVDVIADNMSRMYDQFDEISLNSFVYGASGEYLDYIGSLFGLTRKKQFNASTYGDSTNIKFYVPYGTFGDINDGIAITIPYGTRLWAQSGTDIIEYKTDSSYTLSPEDSEQYISASAITSGAAANISANALRYYDSINYSKKNSNLLLLTNIYPIVNGTNLESDDDFRYRIVNFHTASKTSNLTAIETAAYSFPNVAEVKLIKDVSGGKSLLLVKSVAPTISEYEIEQIQIAVDAVSPIGYKIKVVAPEYLYMEFKFKINFESTLSLDTKTSIKSQISASVNYYINNLDVGESFNYNDFMQYLVSTVPSVSGYVSKSGIVSGMYIIKPIFDTTTKFTFSGNYDILPSQKLLLSTSSTAIVFE